MRRATFPLLQYAQLRTEIIKRIWSREAQIWAWKIGAILWKHLWGHVGVALLLERWEGVGGWGELRAAVNHSRVMARSTSTLHAPDGRPARLIAKKQKTKTTFQFHFLHLPGGTEGRGSSFIPLTTNQPKISLSCCSLTPPLALVRTPGCGAGNQQQGDNKCKHFHWSRWW